MHNVLLVQFEFLPTKPAETCIKIALKHHLTYIWPSVFGWMENMIFEQTVAGYFPSIPFNLHISKLNTVNGVMNIQCDTIK